MFLAMAENIPPPAKPDDDPTRGLPHHDQETEKLKRMLEKQRVLKANIVCSCKTHFGCIA
jgi:hypothetical protein